MTTQAAAFVNDYNAYPNDRGEVMWRWRQRGMVIGNESDSEWGYCNFDDGSRALVDEEIEVASELRTEEPDAEIDNDAALQELREMMAEITRRVA